MNNSEIYQEAKSPDPVGEVKLPEIMSPRINQNIEF